MLNGNDSTETSGNLTMVAQELKRSHGRALDLSLSMTKQRMLASPHHLGRELLYKHSVSPEGLKY